MPGEVGENDRARMRVLRERTKAVHQRTEATRLARAMIDGSITLGQYAAHLHAFLRMHRALEAAIARAAGSAAARLWPPARRKSPLLASDVDALPQPTTSPGVDEALADFERLVAAAPATQLLGVLYVLEGSTLGALVLRPRLEAALRLTPAQTSFYRGYGDATRAMWRAFGDELEAATSDDAALRDCVEGATATFAIVERLFDALA